MTVARTLQLKIDHRLAFIALFALASVWCIALGGARIAYTGSERYMSLAWNLFLAWIPFLFAVQADMLVKNSKRVGATLLALGCGWLLFYPNAPYIITDFVHLTEAGAAPLWFDIVLITSYAFTGLMLGLASMWLVHRIVRQLAGPRTGWAFVILSSFVSAFGIYLGRFQRWNSWDILLQPYNLMLDIASHLAHPFAYPRSLGVTVLFSGFLIFAYIVMYTVIAISALPSDEAAGQHAGSIRG